MKFSLSSISRALFRKEVLRILIVTLVLAGTVTATAVISGGTDGIFGSDECKHEWVEATCKSAKTCSICGEKEGHPIAHKLVEATCTTPKMCSACGTTWDEALGHNWRDATCTTPKTCKKCGEIEGEAPGHDWSEATCVAAKTCKTCKLIEGEALGHDLVVETQEADCTNDGYTKSYCKRCDFEEQSDVTPKLGHLNDVKLEFVAPTCTATGLTEGMHCSRCGKDTVPQTTIRANGHKYDELIDSAEATCTADGYEIYRCTAAGCGEEKTVVLPMIDHDYGDATCDQAAVCTVCGFDNGGEPIGHAWTDATCTAPKTCSRCGGTEGDALGHDMAEANCLAPSTCTRCGHTEGDKEAHTIEMVSTAQSVKYVCPLCNSSFTLGTYYHLNGTKYDGMTIVWAAKDKEAFITDDSNRPIITEDGYYELVKKETTEDKNQIQFWLPSEDKVATVFTSDNGGVGFLSFKFNGYMDQNFDMKIIDGSSGGARWSAEWCIEKAFFNLLPPETKDGKTTTKIIGWNDLVLWEGEVGADKFTGWVDVKIGIVLDANTDTIIMHYYIDGTYVGAESQPLTTSSNGVNCVYVSGNTCDMGSGIKFDDVVFGYTVAGNWVFDGIHAHNWQVSGTPTEPTCTTDGVTFYECSVDGCNAIRRSSTPALGHVQQVVPGYAATCTTDGVTDSYICSVCNATLKAAEVIPGGHTYDSVTTDPDCENKGNIHYTCTVCGDEYDESIDALGHTYSVEADCNAVSSCIVCGKESTEAIGHDYADATCDTPATCVRCGATTGTPREHDMAPANCRYPSTCKLCGHTEGETTDHTLTYKHVRNQLTYYCSVCNKSYAVANKYYLDGSKFDNMQGVDNAKNGFTVSSGNLPEVVDGYYQLIKKSSPGTDGVRKQYQLWVPNNGTLSTNFSLESNAVGFISFKINGYSNDTQTNVELKIVDGRGGSFDWSTMSSAIFQIKSVTKADQTTTDILGLGGRVIKTVELQDDKFTGWLDVIIGIELDAFSGQITLHYIIDGVNVAHYSMDMPISTGKISALYLNGYTAAAGSGVMLDDIGFGYSINGEWKFDDCDHSFTTTVVNPECTKDGYTLDYCSKCGRENYSNVTLATGHVVDEENPATCTLPAKCKICGKSIGEPLGHTGGTPTCTTKPVCDVCGVEYGKAEHDWQEATCYADGYCKVCNEPGDAKTNHNPVASLANGKVTYTCEYCKKYYVLDKAYYLNVEETLGKYTIANEGGWKHTVDNGKFEFSNPGKATKAWVWVPSNAAETGELTDFSNGTVGVLSFSLNVYAGTSFQVHFVDLENRSNGSFWGSYTMQKIFEVTPPSGNVVTVKGNGTELTTINVSDEDKYTGEFNVDIGIVISGGNITLHYYIDGKYIKSLTTEFSIASKKMNGVAFLCEGAVANTGYTLDNVVFGYGRPASTNNSDIFQGEGYTGGDQGGDQGGNQGGNQGGTDVEEDFYISKIDQSQVTNSILKAVVNGKFKQCDQCTERNKQGGTPVYVTADKNGETVQALYVSRTYAWTGSEAEDFTEFRFDCVGKVISISFDYKIKGTVEKNEKHQFTDLDGNKFYADAYLQIKTPTKHAGAGDDYPELSGTDLKIDGEWHTLTYTFTEPTEIINILINLYHFRGEMLIANINADFIA